MGYKKKSPQLETIGEKQEQDQTDPVECENDVVELLKKSFPGVFFVRNQEGKYIDWNENFEKESGYTTEEIPLLPPLTFVAPEDRDIIEEKTREVFNHGKYRSIEAAAITKSGVKKPITFAAKRTYHNGEPLMLVTGIFKDLLSEKFQMNADKVNASLEDRYGYAIEPKIALPTFDGFILVKTKDIIYCEASKNYTLIYMNNGTSHLVSRTLKEYEQQLKKFEFFRIHNSYLINVNYIEKYSKSGGGTITLLNGKVIPVSKRRRECFLKIINKPF